MPKQPSVSIIVPVYNVAEYLPTCLDSLLREQGADVEVLAVDDGSSDACAEILDRYARQYPALKVVTHSVNRGVAAARNTGLDQVTGDYVMFVDADDWLDAGAAGNLAAMAQKCDGDIIIFNYHTVDEKAVREKVTFVKEPAIYHYGNRNQYVDCLTNCGLTTLIWNCFYRAALLQKIRFESYSMGEDVLFSFMALIRASSVCCVTDTFYNYFRRSGSASSQAPLKKEISSLLVMRRCVEEVDANIWNEQARRALLGRIKGWALIGSLLNIIRYSKPDRAAIRAYWLATASCVICSYCRSVSEFNYKLSRTLLKVIPPALMWWSALAAIRLLVIKQQRFARARK